jgi:adenylate cyclase
VTVGDSRAEYEIPLSDASQMLDNLCLKPLIEKTRYEEVHYDRFWEIDVFHGDNEGLIVAEIELTESQDYYQIPSWCSVNVTTDFRFANSSLL